MRRYAVLFAVVLGAMLALFGLAHALDAPVLTDAQPLRGGPERRRLWWA